MRERIATPKPSTAPARKDCLDRRRACIDSYWKCHRTPDSVVALLAGARINGIGLPTGYSAIDDLLVAQRGESPSLNLKS
jgi:hypothetical protein